MEPSKVNDIKTILKEYRDSTIEMKQENDASEKQLEVAASNIKSNAEVFEKNKKDVEAIDMEWDGKIAALKSIIERIEAALK